MLIDVLIVGGVISAIVRGREIGFLRQAFSTAGFFGGLFLGAWLEPHTVTLAHSQVGRAGITILTTLGCALTLLTVGEFAGLHLKHKLLLKRANHIDKGLGSVLAVVSLLFSVWLIAAIFSSLPFPRAQATLHGSWIVSKLERTLPGAPTIIADLGRLIDPNGFPLVFSGREPTPRSAIDLPSLGDMQAAVAADRNSIVRIEGQGCGGIVEGSGFVIGNGLIATNAHVVAGIHQPLVQDSNGSHYATVVWFDPNLDFAVLRANNLAGRPLSLATSASKPGTPGIVLGYPGGGPLTAKVAAVLDQFTANGRNIYDRGTTNRDVYEIQADIIPGNSGGPLVAKDGSVIGVVFAESTSYQHVGYALTAHQVKDSIAKASGRRQAVSTGACAE